MANTIVKPGDLIEISRGPYSHWAIYVGHQEVVHLTSADPDQNSSSSFTLMDIVDGTIAMVKRENVHKVVGNNTFKVNNTLDDEYEARDRHVIVKEACGQVGRRTRYSFSSNNCEHFATEMRYGKPESRQVKVLGLIAGVAAAGVFAAVLGGVLFSSLSGKGKEKRRDYDRS